MRTVEPEAAAATQEEPSFPLSKPGPFFVGTTSVTLVDYSRDGRKLGVQIKYPVLEQTDAEGNVILRDAAADMSGAPYPLILTGTNSGRYLFKPHLASHGFIMATVPNWASVEQLDVEMIDHPWNLLFTLDQLASYPPEGLAGMIDTEHVGVAGYSSGGDYSLAMGGFGLILTVTFPSACKR